MKLAINQVLQQQPAADTQCHTADSADAVHPLAPIPAERGVTPLSTNLPMSVLKSFIVCAHTHPFINTEVLPGMKRRKVHLPVKLAEKGKIDVLSCSA